MKKQRHKKVIHVPTNGNFTMCGNHGNVPTRGRLEKLQPGETWCVACQQYFKVAGDPTENALEHLRRTEGM